MTGGSLRGAVLLAMLVGPIVSAQQAIPETNPMTGTGLLLGRALDGDGHPLAGAEITLNRSVLNTLPVDPTAAPAPSLFPMRVETGADGYFLFHDLPKGTYLVNGSKEGYLAAAFGRRMPTETGTQAITLADGEKRGDVDVTLWKTASLTGSVVDEAGEPLIGVTVRILRRTIAGGKPMLAGPLGLGGAETTDDRGVYRAASLTPGSYVVAVISTSATVPTAYQAYFAEAERTNSFAEAMRELERSQLALGFLGPQAGQRVGSWLVTAGGSNGLPGRQPPAPLLQNGKVSVYPTVFYPSAASAGRATAITLASGEERSGVDFQLRPVPASQISGTVTGLSGPESLMTLTLEPAGLGDAERNLQLATATTLTDSTGAFVFLGVPPGAYTIRGLKMPARAETSNNNMTIIQTASGGTIGSSLGPVAAEPVSDEPTASSATPVTVGDADVANVLVTLSPGARITGHVEFDSNAVATKPAGDPFRTMAVVIQPADGSNQTFPFRLSRASVDASGLVKSFQVPPGRYVVRANTAPPGWIFKSATMGGRDVGDGPLDLRGQDVTDLVITLTDKLAQLSGTARDQNGRDVAAAVVIFPADAKQWTDYGLAPRRLRSVRVGTDGSYTIGGLPPGDYLVAALHDNVSADWLDPAFLARVAPLATHLTIADRETKSQDLTAVEVR